MLGPAHLLDLATAAGAKASAAVDLCGDLTPGKGRPTSCCRPPGGQHVGSGARGRSVVGSRAGAIFTLAREGVDPRGCRRRHRVQPGSGRRKHEVVAAHGFLGRPGKNLSHRAGLHPHDPLELRGGVVRDVLAHGRVSRATSTASPASNSPSTPMIPTGSRRGAAVAQRRAAPASTTTRAQRRLRVLEPELERGRRPGAARSGCRRSSPVQRATARRARSRPITVGMPAAVAISAAATFERIPPEPSAECAGDRQRGQLVRSSTARPAAADGSTRVGREEPGGVGQQQQQVGARRRTATCAARKSLSPKEISSVASCRSR